MSVVIERFLICDGYQCGANFGVDNRQQTTEQHRSSAKIEGWTYKNGKDYCPSCSKDNEKIIKPWIGL